MAKTDLHRRMTEGDTDTDGEGQALSGIPHSGAMGMRLISADDGVAVLKLPYSEALIGDVTTGILGGGAITALLDTCCGTAVFASKQGVRSTATLDLRIDYMRPATPGEAVIARATCYRITRSVAFVRALAYHDDPDRPVATAAAAFIVERKA
jgi:uncharacterized protein (TIGR00369 family)